MACGEPVFIDVDPNTYCMDGQSLPAAVEVEDIPVVAPVHLLGVPANMSEITSLKTKFPLVVVEDAAQALGARYRSAMIGSWGDLSCFSSQATKFVNTYGEGGAVVVNCGMEAYEKIMNLRSHGSGYNNVPYLTYNYRMTEGQADFGLIQLRRM